MTNPFFGRRKPFRTDVSNYETAAAVINRQWQTGRPLDAFDICDQLVAAHPGKAQAILTAVYGMIQSLPNGANRYLYQSRFFEFGIQPGWKVLDIGSGNDPFPLATHQADLTVEDNQYGRAGPPLSN